jgi:hypothetical protein
MELPASPYAPSAARCFVRACLAERGLDAEGAGARAAILVASEMTTNAVHHAREPIRLDLDLSREGVLRLALHDGDPWYVPERTWPAAGEVEGWGVEVVRGLADSWGFGPREDGIDGTEIWAELDLDRAATRYAA